MATYNTKTIIQCDIPKVWKTVLAVEHYHIWRSDVNETKLIDETQFIEYTQNGYSTMYKVTLIKPHRLWELDVENSHTKGHWTIEFAPKGSETELNFTACVTAKKGDNI